jgi:hypothetical protein
MYRILTERKNLSMIKGVLSSLGLDFTIYASAGSWKGQHENSVIIELDHATKKVARSAAKIIKKINKQEKVLLQEIPVRSQLI